MVNTDMMGRDIWLRHTTKAGNSYVSHHVCWDVGLFVARQQANAAKEGGKVEQVLNPKPPKKA